MTNSRHFTQFTLSVALAAALPLAAAATSVAATLTRAWAMAGSQYRLGRVHTRTDVRSRRRDGGRRIGRTRRGRGDARRGGGQRIPRSRRSYHHPTGSASAAVEGRLMRRAEAHHLLSAERDALRRRIGA